eukprot:c21469_g1_i1 orf=227-856(-)
MDWANVTTEELVDALQEVEWSSPPRPLAEFFGKFTVPRSMAKWNSRSKCNLYYYRTNYFVLTAIIFEIAFLRNPLALLAVLLATLCIACLNDSFALSLNQKLMRMARRISPHIAAKMRPSIAPVIRGRPAPQRAVYICGQNRNFVVSCIFAVTILLWFLTSAFITVFGALAFSLICIILHASFRSPNLKARLNTFREEFRAVWRSYSDF